MVRRLVANFPRNLLLALEEGHLLRASGRGAEAAAVYRKIWQDGKRGHYAGLQYEGAAVGLAALLRSQKDYTGAAAAYEMVNEVSYPDPECLQSANLGAGQMYDVLQRRDLALKKYQAVVATDGRTSQAASARKYMQQPYRE